MRDDPARQTVPPPTDALVFKFPASLRIAMLGCAVVCLGFFACVVVMQLVKPERGSLILSLLSFILCGIGLAYSLKVVCYSADRVAVSSEGIWYLPKNRTSSFIAWSDVSVVKANDTMQRLIVTDASARRTIRAEYQLENFAALREFISSHTDELSRQATPVTRVFHRTWINKIVLTVFGLPFLILFVQCYREGVADGFYFGLALWAGTVILIALDPVTLTIDPESIQISYPLWSRSISFDSIIGIVLKDVSSRGNVWTAVVIERQQKRRVQLFRFREGSIVLKDALESAWRISQASRVDIGTKLAARGE
ncbi:MAG: hypothetical protein ABR907_16705 [Terracidiphilus sp.]|jgi:hypothetical protein